MLLKNSSFLLESITINNRIIAKMKICDLINHDIKIPTIQRLDDKNKTNEIVNYQMKYFHSGKNHLNILGVINIHCCKETNNNYILDGQHRLNSLKILNDYGNISNECVSIEIVSVDTMDELKENYKLINMNSPLPDFPENIDKNIPEQAFRHFESKWPTLIWSTSSKPNRPNLNKSHLQEAFAYLTSELNINKYSDLVEIIEEKNEKMSLWNVEKFDEIRKYKNTGKIIEKCQLYDVYLGMYPHINQDYSYEWVSDIIKDKKGYEPNKKSTYKKKSIPKNIRREVWKKWVGENNGIGTCFCCRINTFAQMESWHAGHVISENDGGEIHIDNLRPICSSCNSSMGTTNMREYMESIKEFTPNLSMFDESYC